MKKKPTNHDHFASSNEKAKSRIVVQMVRLARKERLDYTDFIYACQQARKKLGLRRPKKERKLPQLLPEAELKKFFRVIQQCGNLQHEKSCRNCSSLRQCASVNWSGSKSAILISLSAGFVKQGKGQKDRYILFPASFRLVLQSHLRANPKNRYLFETTRCMPFTTRRVQQIVKQYRDEAGIAQHVHPHLFRHQMITYLTARGLSDSQIQLISGHESKKSLEVYQHLSLKNVEQAYQEAVETLEV